MKRPIESDYTSQVAYTRALEAYCDSLVQPAQEPVVLVATNSSGQVRMQYSDGSAFDISKHIGQSFYTAPQQQEPRNFCSRCGKRTADLTVIHTCTPPEGGHQ
jgi:hypothetical protein